MVRLSHIPIPLQNEDNAVSQKLHKIEVSPSFLELADGLESTVKVTSWSLKRASLITVMKISIIILYTKNYKALYGIYGSNKWHMEAAIISYWIYGKVERNFNTNNEKYNWIESNFTLTVVDIIFVQLLSLWRQMKQQRIHLKTYVRTHTTHA